MGQKCGANGRIRTVDLLFTKRALLVLFYPDTYVIRTTRPRHRTRFIAAVLLNPDPLWQVR
jgi:hypothetical protein